MLHRRLANATQARRHVNLIDRSWPGNMTNNDTHIPTLALNTISEVGKRAEALKGGGRVSVRKGGRGGDEQLMAIKERRVL